ncbi:MAG: hypothetical protein KAQ67_04895 [Gammaproteobacteria bacterium]|nr:hypothetical protein [Gammaproteobacteria bacterium]
MSDVFSEFHDQICQGSHFLYSAHFEDSIAFYKQLGFIQIHKEDKYICILRMKHIYIELWDNDNRFPTTASSDIKQDCLNSSLIIYLNSHQNLLSFHQHVLNQNIAANEKALHDDSHPLGYNFFVTDPDNNRVTFATGPVWSYPFYYENQCKERLEELIQKSKTEEKETPSNIVYPDFGDDLEDLILSDDDPSED